MIWHANSKTTNTRPTTINSEVAILSILRFPIFRKHRFQHSTIPSWCCLPNFSQWFVPRTVVHVPVTVANDASETGYV